MLFLEEMRHVCISRMDQRLNILLQKPVSVRDVQIERALLDG